MLQDITMQHACLQENIKTIPKNSPLERSMEMMLEAVDNLLKVYKSIRPLSSLWASACQRRRAAMKGPDDWSVVRDATTSHDVNGTLFDIPPDRVAIQPLRIKDFKLEVVTEF